jgi:hypothetical protein
MSNTASTRANPSTSLVLPLAALAIGILSFYGISEKPVTRGELFLAWGFISMTGSMIYHVNRGLLKRIDELESEVAALRKR